MVKMKKKKRRICMKNERKKVKGRNRRRHT